MNKKIKEILENVGGYGTQALLYPEDIEKFAFLIMEECATACNDFSCGRENSAQDLINRMFEISYDNNISENYTPELPRHKSPK